MLCGVLSCQKDEQGVTSSHPQDIAIEGDILKFASHDAYEELLQTPKVLDNLLAEQSFQSFHEVSKSARLSGEDDKGSSKKDAIPETLARMLNKDGVYQIGDWILKLNFKSKKVFVLESSQRNKLYQDLVAERVSEKVWVFTFDDEVLDLLASGYKSSPSKGAPGGRPAIFCGSGIAGDPDPEVRSSPYRCSPTDGLSSDYNKIEYSKYGVYFECDLKWGGQADFFINDGQTLGACAYTGTISKKYFLETNCRNSWTRSDEQYNAQYTLALDYSYGDDVRIIYYTGRERIYQGSRGLRCLKIDFFNVTNGAGITLNNQLTRGC